MRWLTRWLWIALVLGAPRAGTALPDDETPASSPSPAPALRLRLLRGAALLEEARDGAAELGRLSEGEEVEVLAPGPEGFWRVRRESLEGYVLQEALEVDEEAARALRRLRGGDGSGGEARAEATVEAEAPSAEPGQRETLDAKAREKALARRRSILMSRYGRVVADRILAHKYWPGMNHQMVIESLGKPDARESANVAGLMHDSWTYGRYNLVLVFENGRLVLWNKLKK